MTARSLASLEGATLSWRQPKRFEQFFELRLADEPVGSLAFRSSFGTLALAETADGSWSYKRVGFMSPRVTVREAGSQDDLAVHQPRMWGDGQLVFKDGASFLWRPVNFWMTAWEFADPAGAALIRLTGGLEDEKLSDILRTQATIEIKPGAGRCGRLPILATLAFYLTILRHLDAAATGGAVVATM